MADAIVVLNAGSSSVKFSLFVTRGETLAASLQGQIEGLYTTGRFVARAPDGSLRAENSWPEGTSLGHDGALDYLIAYLRAALSGERLIGIGHRVVHGGLEFTRPVRVDAAVLQALEKFVPLAPLHQPHNLAPIRRALERAPELPQAACFDTAFHAAQAEVARMFALPAEMTRAGIVRYGFHGLSYEYIASVMPAIAPQAAQGRIVVLHLGNGASMCALSRGRSVASTMGFTALEGLMMGTRCGALDPGVVLYLMDQRGMDARAIEKLLYQQSGLLGVSSLSSDMRVLLESDAPGAKLAVDLFVYRIRRELGSLAAALGGLDALVFAGGIGENAPEIRRRVCADAAWLGVEIGPALNQAGQRCISTGKSRVEVYVVPTNEELMIARHTRRLLESHEERPHAGTGPTKSA